MNAGAIDFIYDGIQLSDKGYMICQFNGATDQISNGAEITFSEVPLQHGIKKAIAGVSYETVITTTFDICKNLCNTSYNDIYLSTDDVRELARWLQRKEYLPFVLLADGYTEITYFGSFKVDQIKVGSKIVGLELTFTTNSPFGWQRERRYTFENVNSFTISDSSDETGFLYPKFEITCLSAGDLTLTNDMDDNITIINGCSANEKITIEHPIILTDKTTHNIANDFNYMFPKIGNTFRVRRNNYTLSLLSNVVFTYRPLAKIGV